MNVPENDAKRVPHALKEVQSTAQGRKGWSVMLMLTEAQGGRVQCESAETIEGATANGQAYLDKHMPGRTL